jgi:hypothetical protein
MPWSITEPTSTLDVVLLPVSGDITVEEQYVTTVLYARRGTSPWVSDSVGRVPTISIPECVITSRVTLDRLRAIRDLGRRIILTDDMGTAWPCKFRGPLTYRIEDTPDRAAGVRFFVTIDVVGVA